MLLYVQLFIKNFVISLHKSLREKEIQCIRRILESDSDCQSRCSVVEAFHIFILFAKNRVQEWVDQCLPLSRVVYPIPIRTYYY